jgi:hypothetical protein
MKQIDVALENCYGIRRLEYRFDFSEQSVYAIYAPNGSMKSSLAQTFKDITEGEPSEDRIFPARVSVRRITDENGSELPKESVLVLQPYDEFFGPTEKTSTLLVNNVLRKEFEQLHTQIDKSKAAFLKAMKEQSGSKKELDAEIALAFMKSDDENSFYLALERAKIELADQRDAPFAEVKYDLIFDDKVLGVLGTTDVKAALEEYINRYNTLLAASTYFKKGVFEYYNAGQIAKTLADNGFFDAKHTLVLNAAKKTEIGTKKELEAVINAELENITQDKKLKKIFADLKKLFEKNVTVRDFQAYLCDHASILPHLKNVGEFKEKVWRSYFKANEAAFDDLLGHYRRVKTRRKEIEEQARKERTLWETAIDEFNYRFSVPFTLEAKNKAAVALAHESMLDLTYTFNDSSDSTPVVRDTLMKSLSQGEKKALYILNIIFEIEVRRKNKQETLFVVDDVADSFDYKNKYAIIQYLKDIAAEPTFRQIILTHNFDFFRTLKARLWPSLRSSHCLMVTKSNDEVSFHKAKGVQNVFVKDWKPHFFTDQTKKIAAITFTRNIVEYTKGSTDTDYVKLTSLLHWKADTPGLLEEMLDDIYVRVFGLPPAPPATHKPIIDIIDEEAKTCMGNGGGANFEQKIVLAIAIRMTAERFMVKKIANKTFVDGILRNQTTALLDKFESMFPKELDMIKTLRGVVLMTPEQIHLNSFMFEPILDMSDEHLRKLYKAVRALK